MKYVIVRHILFTLISLIPFTLLNIEVAIPSSIAIYSILINISWYFAMKRRYQDSKAILARLQNLRRLTC